MDRTIDRLENSNVGWCASYETKSPIEFLFYTQNAKSTNISFTWC
jgi:hypothetical protein